MTDQATDPTTDPAAPDPTPVTPEQPAAPAEPGNDDTRPERQAARYRTERNELQQQLEQAQAAQKEQLAAIAKALGLAPEETDPAAQVQELTAQVENAQAELAQARAELAVHDLAADNGGNPQALLDSRSFLNTLATLDASAEDYRTRVALAIKDAVSKNANLRSKGQGPARGGAPGAGQGPADPDGAVTKEQFDAMPYAEKAQLFRTNPDLYRRLAGS